MSNYNSPFRDVENRKKALVSPSTLSFPIKASEDGNHYSIEQRKKSQQRIRDLDIRLKDLRQSVSHTVLCLECSAINNLVIVLDIVFTLLFQQVTVGLDTST